jgi:hypothetical protein
MNTNVMAARVCGIYLTVGGRPFDSQHILISYSYFNEIETDSLNAKLSLVLSKL